MMRVAIIKATVFALGPTYFSSIDLCQSAPLKAGLIGFDESSVWQWNFVKWWL
jgi:hypothetical protein